MFILKLIILYALARVGEGDRSLLLVLFFDQSMNRDFKGSRIIYPVQGGYGLEGGALLAIATSC